MNDWDVVVLLGSRWSALRDHGTRWRAVATAWTQDPRVASVTVVDYPTFGKAGLRHPHRLATTVPSWHEDIRAIHADVPLPRRATPLDAWGWRAVARQLRGQLVARGRRRLVVAATPLWAPVLGELHAERVCFDAVDDWRSYPDAQTVIGRVEAGYRAVRNVEHVTANSDVLADRLRHDYGVTARVVSNGVDVEAYLGPRPDRPPGLPSGPYVVYVAVLDDRLDVDLLAAVAAGVPDVNVVVAGRASAQMAQRLHDAKVTWLGALPVSTVPALLRNAAAGLVPHRLDHFTASMDPMKVLEYLAAGLPVVTTPLPGLGAHSTRVLVADDVPSFVADVRQAVTMPTLDEPDPAVLQRSWTSVATALLDEYLREAGTGDAG